MKTLKNTFSKPEYDFESLSKTTKNILSETLKEYFSNLYGPDLFIANSEPDEIEYHSRSGFILSSYNRGGLVLRGFTDIHTHWSTGYRPSHKKAAKEIENQIEYGHSNVRESVYEAHKDLFDSLNIIKDQIDYNLVESLNNDDIMRTFERMEEAYLMTSENSIMYEMRVMYHGCEKGIHKASVSAIVNTEGPYHRSHISWAPNVFCEGVKEVEITWRNESGLKAKLDKAFKQVIKCVF